VDCVTLLDEAEKAGLRITVKGERIVVRGPRHAGDLAELLLARKREVIALLAGDPGSGITGNSEERARDECPGLPATLPDLELEAQGDVTAAAGAQQAQVAALDHLDLRRQVWQLARSAGFPALRIRQYQQVAGAEAWTTFSRTVGLRWLEAAAETLGPMAAPAGATEADGRPLWFCACGYRCWSRVDQPQWYCSNCGRWARGPPGGSV
jgi:hypothetical protein